MVTIEGGDKGFVVGIHVMGSFNLLAASMLHKQMVQ
jgi:hypothetical protein